MNIKLVLITLCLLLKGFFAGAQDFHPIANFKGYVTFIKFSRTGKWLAVCNPSFGTTNGSLDLYDSKTEKIIGSVPCNTYFVAFSADDSTMLISIDRNTIGAFSLTDPTDPKKLFEYKADNIWCGDISNNGKYFALGSDDGQAFVIDAATKQVVASSRPFEAKLMGNCCYNNCNFCPVWGIKVLNDRQYLVAGAGMTGRIKIFDFDRNVLFTTPNTGEMLGWSADAAGNHFLVNVIADNPVYTITNGIPVKTKVGTRVSSLVFTPSGHNIVGISEGKVILYDSEGKKLGSVTDKKYLGRVLVSDVSADEKKMAFILEKSLVIGDFEAIKNAVR